MEKLYYKYLANSNDDKNWGLYLNVVGLTSIPPNSKYPITKHPDDYHFSWEQGRVLNEFQIIYITKGNGTLETKNNRFEIQAGTILIIRPGMWHRYKPDKKIGWDEYYIGFNGKLTNHFFEQHFFANKYPIFQFGYSEKLLNQYMQIIEIVKEEPIAFQKIVSGIIISMFGQIISTIKNKEFAGKEIEKIIKKARIFLRANINKKVDIKGLADELNISYSYFRQMFRKFTDVSPVQFHLLLKIQKAQNMLISTNKSVKEIALILGFESNFYFSRIFKTKIGYSPNEYRKQFVKNGIHKDTKN